MTCLIIGCTGPYELHEVVHTVRQGARLGVIKRVPAEVGRVCGDVLFTPATMRRLEALRQTTAAPMGTVPLYDFTTPLSASPVGSLFVANNYVQ